MGRHCVYAGRDRRRRRREKHLLLLVSAIVFAAWGHSAEARCDLRPGERGVVSQIIDGDTMALDTGLEVRLIGSLAPNRPADIDDRHPWPLANQAKGLLTSLAKGKPVHLFYGGRRHDRHGRALAHVFVVTKAGRTWLQGALIDAGLARAYSHPDNRACLQDLLEREARARDAGQGLWRDREYRQRSARDLSRLYHDLHSFQVVKGRVHAIGKARGRLYLNFEANWRRDFTAAISRKALAAMLKDGFNPALLKDRQVRIRGWIERRNGPLIAVTHREQIEVVDGP